MVCCSSEAEDGCSVAHCAWWAVAVRLRVVWAAAQRLWVGSSETMDGRWLGGWVGCSSEAVDGRWLGGWTVAQRL